MDVFTELFTDHTLRTVALGAATLGIVAGALGTFAVLRQQSLLGDAMSHAALPGIAVAYLLTGSKAPIALMVGAAIAGLVGTLIVMVVVRTTRVKQDSALGIVLAVFFGVGLVLLTLIQRRPDASQAGLDRFLFGQAASVLERDLVTMAALGSVALLGLLLLWKELKLLAFDPAFGSSMGFSMRLVDILLTALLVVAIVVGLQTVGVVLMSAIVVAPAVAARQWSDRLGVVVCLAALTGAFAGVIGALISSEARRLPTGPTIVLCAAAIVVISLLFAPRGLLWRTLRDARNRRRLRVGSVLADLYALADQHGTLSHGHSESALAALGSGGEVRRTLRELEGRGWVQEVGAGDWALTPAGLSEAERRFGRPGLAEVML